VTEFSRSEKKDTILEIKNLRVEFNTYRGKVKALNGVNLNLYKEEVLSLVGESGCGKSVTALTIIDLLPENATVLGGQILLTKEDLLKKSNDEIRTIRAKRIATVFQDPMTFLNPVLTIETQLEETFTLDKEGLKQAAKLRRTKIGREREGLSKRIMGFRRTKKAKKKEDITYLEYLSLEEQSSSKSNEARVSRGEIKETVRALCTDVLKLVKLADPERILSQYPFELSGGMRQRAMIAMALARRPAFFIADEITTALDVTVQAQILHLLRELKDKIGSTTLMITHDLAVAAEIADRIAVMYGGHVVEAAETREIFRSPLHPYTKLLMRAIPNVTRLVESLETIPGTVPDMIDPPPGCPFHPRCPNGMVKCVEKFPGTTHFDGGHEVACYLYGD
jgi:oligopeptide/dipeptide ABC transporter ATP-binding protein